MDIVDNGAIQLPHQFVGIPVASGIGIHRHFSASRLDLAPQHTIAGLDERDVLASNEVEAIAKIDNCPDHERLFVGARFSFLRRPFKRPLRIVFPKIDAESEPVISLFTRENG